MSGAYRLALFDLDGTLSDSSPGIFATLKETFPLVGRPIPGPEVLRKFIGPPLWNSAHELAGMPTETADQFVGLFRERYEAKGLFENDLYPGMRKLLESLRKEGVLTGVVTSKPVTPAGAVLKYLKIDALFDYFSAADDSDKGGGKEELIFPVLEQSGVSASQTVMIGDTKFDASGARKAGTNFLGVLYGFGTREEMEREGGKQFTESVEGLGRILLPEQEKSFLDNSGPLLYDNPEN